MSEIYDENNNPFVDDENKTESEEISAENESLVEQEIPAEPTSTSTEENIFSDAPAQNVNSTPSDTAYRSGHSYNGYRAADNSVNNYNGQYSSQNYTGQQYGGSYQQPSNNTPYGQNYNYNSNSNQYYTPPTPQEPEKKKGKGKKVLFVLLIILVIAASLGIGVSIGGKSKSPSSNNNKESSDGTTAVTTSVAVEVETTKASSSQLSAVDVADKVRPQVVGVMAYINGQLEGEGSGVIFYEDNAKKYTYIMTCAHVISDDGLEFSVLTLDGKPYDAKLVGFDERTDIGVLRIEASGLPVATLGDSSSLKIGENVYAIGNPGGSEYFGSMTSGIVSAIDRSISSTYTMKVIQHDAAINPGNSGGALVNTYGQIIGINSSKIADTEFEGMGFAIPMSTAKSVAESLITYGYVPNRPMLGIKYADVSNYQLYSMLVGIKGLPQGSLIISSIATNSDLANQDVKAGDLIIAVNGTNMDTSDILLDLIENSKVGDVLTLTICRVDTKSYKTNTFDVKVKLVEDKGNTTYADEQETTTQGYGGYPFGDSDSYEDFFRQFFGF